MIKIRNTSAIIIWYKMPISSQVFVDDAQPTLSTPITLEKFIEILSGVAETNILYTCSRSMLEEAFNSLTSTRDNPCMTGTQLIQFATALKEHNKEMLIKQIGYYYGVLDQMSRSGMETVQKYVFEEIIDKGQGGMLGQILKNSAQGYRFLSIKKIKEVVREMNDVVESNEQNEEHSINTIKIGISEIFFSHEPLVNQKSQIHQKQAEQNMLLAKQINSLFSYLQTNLTATLPTIIDPHAAYTFQNFIGTLSAHQKSLLQSAEFYQQEINKLSQGIKETQQEYWKQTEEIEKLQKEKDKQRQRRKQAEERAREQQKKMTNFMKQSQQIEENNESIRIKYNILSQAYEELKQTYSQTKKQLSALYSKFDAIAASPPRPPSIFKARTQKEQLQDATLKISRLLQQNGKLIRLMQQKELMYTARIEGMEKECKEIQEAFRKREERQKVSVMYHMRNSILSHRSSVTDSNVPSVIRSSKVQVVNQNKKQISIVVESKKEEKKEEVNEIPKEDKKSIVIPSHLRSSADFDNKNAVSTQQIKKQLRSHQSPILPMEASFKKKPIGYLVPDTIKELSQEEEVQFVEPDQSQNEKLSTILQQENKRASQKGIPYFIAPTIIFTRHGHLYEKILLVTQTKIVSLDTKFRPQQYLPFSHILRITVCTQNQNILVFHVRKDKINEKSSINQCGKLFTRDTVFVIKQRKALLNFIGKYIDQITQSGVKLNVQREDKVWMRYQNQNEYLLSNYTEYMNPFRIAIGSTPNVFHVTIEEKSFLSSASSVILIVQPLGLFCFAGSTTTELANSQNLSYLLPLIERMKIGVKGNCLAIEYEDWKKEFMIDCGSKQQLKRLKEAIQNTKSSNEFQKKKRIADAERILNKK